MTGIKSSSASSYSSEKAFLGDDPIPIGYEFAVIIILTNRILFNHSGNFFHFILLRLCKYLKN